MFKYGKYKLMASGEKQPIYIRLSVCLVTLITHQLKYVSTWDFDEIKHSSSGNSKIVVKNR